jgi:branched-chain amino acid transport system permease protein
VSTDFLQFTAGGLTSGAIYGLLALGWVLVMRVSGLLFFLQGEFVVVGVFIIVALQDRGASIAVAAVAAIAACVVSALAVDGLIIRRLRSATPMSEVLVLLGLALLAGHALQQIAGPNARGVKPFLPMKPVSIFGAFVTPHQIAAVVVTAVATTVVWFCVTRTSVGRAMQACADNPEGAVLVGIRPLRLRTLGFVGAAVIGGVAAVVLGPLAAMTPLGGLLWSLKGFIAAVLSRWSFMGAVGAGIFLGLIESYGAGYISSVYKDVISLSVLILVLLLQGVVSREAITQRLRTRRLSLR